MEKTNKTIQVSDTDAGQRLDNFIVSALGLTRSNVTKLIKYDNALLNDKSVKAGTIVKAGDTVSIVYKQGETELLAQDIPLDVIYEDKDIAIINKKQGMTVHPGGGIYEGTLANAILYRFKSLKEFDSDRPGIVHRLDKDTSGVIIIALNEKAHANISKQIADREVTKIYHALCESTLETESGEINTLIDRNQKERKLMAVSTREGRVAITRYKLLKNFEKNCLVEFNILTGRTHQIRVHAKYMGNPVVGDLSYGYRKQRFKLDGQLLHAYSVEFTHPSTGKKVKYTAPLPTYFKDIVDKLTKEQKELNED